MRRFSFSDAVCEEGSERFEKLMADAYRSGTRPLCLCRDEPVAMCIADLGDQFVIKRMPLSGGIHHPACPSYEPPYELSGLGSLLGSAINLDPVAGTTSLKLDFSLSKRTAVTTSNGTPSPSTSVRGENRRLSLRGLLHYLWHESGLTEWTHHWAGKRHWWQVYHHLADAARRMEVRGQNLTDRMFLPEPFRLDDKAAIERRRAQRLATLYQSQGRSRQLFVFLGEIKEFADARSGRRVVIKQMPGFRLHLDQAAWRSVERRFKTELALWQQDDAMHLMTIMTIGGTSTGVTTVNEIALMLTTEHWLPVEDAFEKALVDRMARQRMRWTKGLRFDLTRSQPLANAILLERRTMPCALYIVPPDADDEFDTALQSLIAARADMASWVWRAVDGEMPPLPL